MQIMISTFYNTLYFKNQTDQIKERDLEKIVEFQNNGNLFGFILYHNKDIIEAILKQHGITADFYIHQNGRVEIKDKMDYFSYEPFYPVEIESFLEIINEDFKGMLFSKNKRELIDSNKEINLNQTDYNFAILKVNNHQIALDIEKCLTNKFGHILKVIVQDNELSFYSKKGSLEDGIEYLKDILHVNIDQIHILKDCFIDVDLLKSFNHFYTLNQQEWGEKDIVAVESVCDCIEHIMENTKNKFII